jgi:iron complex transport system ATP-binding protein
MRIRADHVERRAGPAVLLAGVVLDAAPGSTVAVLGPNGSGKSTLLRVLAGLHRPDRGRVLVDGTDRAVLPRRDLARRIAVVTQHTPADVEMTVRDVLLLGRIPHRPLLAGVSADDVARTDRALDAAGLPGFATRRWASLSGGEQQRVSVARALVQEPDVLLLDEPTNHLDVRHALDLMADLARMPATVVVALHDLDLAAQYGDEVVLLHHGRVVAAGPPAGVLTPARIAGVFGVGAEVARDGHGRCRVRLHRLGAAG